MLELGCKDEEPAQRWGGGCWKQHSWWRSSMCKGPVAGGRTAPARASPAWLCPQVRLCHHAQVTQQDDGRQTVGAALDQELLVRGALAAGAPQLPLTGVFARNTAFHMLRTSLRCTEK